MLGFKVHLSASLKSGVRCFTIRMLRESWSIPGRTPCRIFANCYSSCRDQSVIIVTPEGDNDYANGQQNNILRATRNSCEWRLRMSGEAQQAASGGCIAASPRLRVLALRCANAKPTMSMDVCKILFRHFAVKGTHHRGDDRFSIMSHQFPSLAARTV